MNSTRVRKQGADEDDLLPEYDFDYARGRPNRFAESGAAVQSPTPKRRRPTQTSGLAGEFLVMERLYRLGHQPALTLGNAKSIDILVASRTARLYELSVKAGRRATKWPVDGADQRTGGQRIFVFVNYPSFEDLTAEAEVYVVPAEDVQRLKRPWQGGFAVYCSNAAQRAELQPYRDAWQTIA